MRPARPPRLLEHDKRARDAQRLGDEVGARSCRVDVRVDIARERKIEHVVRKGSGGTSTRTNSALDTRARASSSISAL
jgi:hypothetical protein